jgi:hypothetical protein
MACTVSQSHACLPREYHLPRTLPCNRTRRPEHHVEAVEQGTCVGREGGVEGRGIVATQGAEEGVALHPGALVPDQELLRCGRGTKPAPCLPVRWTTGT